MRERRRKFNGNYKSGIVLGKASFSILVIAIMFSLSMLYLLQSNSYSVKGTTLSELEKKKIELEEERDRLQVEATRLQSLQEIEKSLDKKDGTSDYVPVTKINYLPSLSVAVK